MIVTIDIHVQSTCVAQHVCDLYFIVTSCGLTLALLSLACVIMHYPSYTFTSTFSEFELFAVHLADPRAQNVNTLH